jgi:hypothetical protein
MGLRSELLAELVREVLGPRNGPFEEMEASPLDEYLTGVLQPAGVQALEADGEADRLPEEAESGEEDTDAGGIPPVVFTPAMDPRMRPSSMGLSFRVRVPAGGAPRLAACITWARYQPVREGNEEAGEEREGREGEGRIRRWRRNPRAWILDPLPPGEVRPGQAGRYRDGSGAPAPPEEELSLHVLQEREGDDPQVFRVIIHLVNRIQPRDPRRVRPEECLFQPQIRVICLEGTRLEPSGRSIRRQDPEEERLDFLYRDRPVLARGHLVSAVWKDIDPERPAPPDLEPERPDGPPFRWMDGSLLDPQDQQRFTAPDVRTEFVPIYALHAPEWDWDPRYGPEPERDPARLAELAANPAELRRALEPLLQGYQAWIREQESQAAHLPDREWRIAEGLLQECRGILDRMRTGLELLERDPDVRLAFAFASQAMAIQARWQGRTLRWRPFQLAFILLNLRSIARPDAPDREICDLLWIPTGGGKTEAYLALAAFAMAFRRRRALSRQQGDQQVDRTGAGVAVISRYTLRLLTIQQFRRALALITACEFLRVQGLRDGRPVGWRPPGWPDRSDFLWGSTPFRIGLWVGGGLTPNRLETIFVQDPGGAKRRLAGALDILGGERGEGEPAQILQCPACRAWLAIPEEGLPPGDHELHLVIRQPQDRNPLARIHRLIQRHPGNGFQVELAGHPVPICGSDYLILSLRIHTDQPLKARILDDWWKSGPGQHLELQAFRPSRPGYFPVKLPGIQNPSRLEPVDFEIWCPSPNCELGGEWWCAGVPADSSALQRTGRTGQRLQLGRNRGRGELPHPFQNRPLRLPDGQVFRTVPEIWQVRTVESQRGPDPARFLACRIPIPALTVDKQIYLHPPSMVIATVDKFARLPFEPDAAALFGNVSWYEVRRGYCREPESAARAVPVGSLDPPDLILQDELHLIEGPLGSLAGLYETAIDHLCQNQGRPVKYIAATATIRAAETQVESLFHRRLQIFPPPGLHVGDRFFMRALREPHPLEEQRAGQLYAGICAPGRGPLTPVYRIWACLLQQVYRRQNHPDADFFWTLTGYFNAIRELAGALALYRQDIPQRIRDAFPNEPPRPLSDTPPELSSRIPSTDLPALLDRLDRSRPEAPDALLATSMFGTGVDIPRLSLMVVHGQPKTTASYIQATGRVGRQRGALVVTFLRASRPRDLSHYEFFCGYHRQLHRHVEPVTVMPFSPGAMDLGTGPVMVAILRHRRDVQPAHPWHREDAAGRMAGARFANEVRDLPQILESRAQSQPPLRRPDAGIVQTLAESGLDRWAQVARLVSQLGGGLRFVEYAIGQRPQHPVVLGDPEHQRAGLHVVFENVPQSLRDVEETLDFDFR